MNPQQQKSFNKFKDAILKRSGTKITVDELYVLINRVTYSDRKRYFGYKWGSKLASRTRYYRHWIKILEGLNILQPMSLGLWEVKKVNI